MAAAHGVGLTVVPIPGASAVPAALAASGLEADRFLFLGFSPRRGGDRSRWIDQLAGSEVTIVAFESPNRLADLLRDMVSAGLGERRAVVCRELTKLHEEIRPGRVVDLANLYHDRTVKGEVTLVVEGAQAPGGPVSAATEAAAREVADRLAHQGLTTRDIVGRLQEEFGLTRNAAYRVGLARSPVAKDDRADA